MFEDEIKAALAPHGIAITGGPYGSVGAEIECSDKWVIRLDGSSMLKRGQFAFVDLALSPKGDVSAGLKGTHHRFHSIAALRTSVPQALASLKTLAANDSRIVCPACKRRWVHLKEASPYGKQFRAFLSCDGMQIVGRGRDKHVACNGTNAEIPAIVDYH